MSQSISLWGATYSNVPAVQLPKSPSGTATFTDVTDTTATASDVASGTYFYTSAGVKTEGTATIGGGGSNVEWEHMDESDSTTTSAITFTGLQGEPTSFCMWYDGNFTPSATAHVQAIVFDGTSLHAQTITNTNNAQVSYASSGFTKSYSNGTLTITSTGAQFLDEDTGYCLDYSYGGTAENVQTANVQVGSGATSITFTGLEDEPIGWSCIFKSDFSTSSGYQRVIWVDFCNNQIIGACMDSGSYTYNSYWTSSYSSGSLTITSQGTNAGGYFHQPGYYQLTYVVGGDGSITAEPLSVTTNGTYTAPRGKAYTPVTVNVPQQGGATVATTTMNNTSATATSIEFTSLSGQPKAFFVRCTSNMARNSSNRYYYIADIRWDGSSTGGVAGNKFYMYNGTYSNQTTGYSYTYSNGTLTLSTTGSQSASPGSFFNGTYELVYIY